MYFNAIGFPRNNFAPYKGDTFKAFYLFFLLSISFLYLSSHLFQKITKLKLLLSVVFVICIFFIGGHPKQNNQEISEGLVIRNEFAVFCELNNAIFFNNSLNFVHKSGNMSDLESDCQSLSLSRNKFKKSFFKINTSDPYYKKCLYKGEINIKYSNYVECRMFAINEVRRKNESMVTMATAHPAKFEEAINQALPEEDVPIPPQLSSIVGVEEKFVVLPNDIDKIREYILRKIG